MQLWSIRTLCAIVTSFAVSACGPAFDPPQATLLATGPYVVDTTKQTPHTLFQQAYGAAFEAAKIEAANYKNPEDKYRQMAIEGFGVVRANCSDFFSKRGDSQQTIGVTRDLVAVGGATATAIVGLAGGSALALSIIALSGATLYSGLDVYAKNYLFAAENIENVRTLTLRALDVHAKAVLKENTEWTFQNSVGALLDNQEICKPANIASLVRQAIRVGKPEPSDTDGSFAVSFDGTLKQLIGATAGLSVGVVPDDSQLAALCWGSSADLKSPEQLEAIKKLLPIQPFFKGPNSPDWAFISGAVATNCQKLSDATRGTINKQIAGLKTTINQAAGTAPPTVPDLKAAVSATPSSPSSSGAASGAKSISINVR